MTNPRKSLTDPRFLTYFYQSLSWITLLKAPRVNGKVQLLPRPEVTPENFAEMLRQKRNEPHRDAELGLLVKRLATEAFNQNRGIIKAKPFSGLWHQSPAGSGFRRAISSLRTAEITLNAISDDGAAAPLAPVVTYYALYQSLVAHRMASGGSISTHAAGGAYFAQLAREGLIPQPFDLRAVGGASRTFRIVGSNGEEFVPKVTQTANLTQPKTVRDLANRVGQSLVTTRQEGRSPDYLGIRKNGKPSKHDTTVLDWLFRLRHRAQYGDSGVFTPGQIDLPGKSSPVWVPNGELQQLSWRLMEISFAISAPLLAMSIQYLGEELSKDVLHHIEIDSKSTPVTAALIEALKSSGSKRNSRK